MLATMAAIGAAVVWLLVPSAASATDISSTFDTSNENWLVNQGDSPTLDPANWLSTGGNPGGYIDFTDTVGDSQGLNGSLLTFDKWTGDLSSRYSGTVSFDMKATQATSGHGPAVVFLSQNGYAGAGFTSAPGADWTHYSVTLNENKFQGNTDGTGPRGALTQAQLVSILSAVQGVAVGADVYNGTGEVVGLDNLDLGPPSIHRTLTIAYKKAAHAFHGALSGNLPSCIVNQPVAVLKKHAGADIKVGSGFTDSGGFYAVGAAREPGTYYAKVKKTTLDDAVCLAAKSPTLHLG